MSGAWALRARWACSSLPAAPPRTPRRVPDGGWLIVASVLSGLGRGRPWLAGAWWAHRRQCRAWYATRAANDTPEGNSPQKSAVPSIATIREIDQPPAIRGRATAEHWSADLYWRRVSPYLTRTFIGWGLSADAVTVGVILVGWLAALSLLVPPFSGPLLIVGPLLAAVFAQLQMLVDASDG